MELTELEALAAKRDEALRALAECLAPFIYFGPAIEEEGGTDNG